MPETATPEPVLSYAQGIPCVDIAPFLGATDKGGVAREFGKALEEVGFVAITGHGIPESLSEAAYRQAIAFFDRPLEEKLKATLPDRLSNRGYIPFGVDSVAATRNEEAPPDLCEALMFLNLVKENPGRPQGGIDPDSGNPWPVYPPRLRASFLAFSQALFDLSHTLMRISALALDLPEEYFIPFMDPNGGVFRAVHYPDQPQEPLPGQLRYGAHSDYGGLTILLQDQAPGGLQVCLQSGEWVDVKPLPNSFVINVGDLIARWTNDRWRSTLHRVINPPRNLSGSTRRLSLVYFTGPRADAWIECLPTCQSESNPPRYEAVRAGEYIRRKIEASVVK
ncbi:MAG: 2-oxoglutarate and iron-dependent oxygenase domain-containing protein [Thermostichus sp. HHBFW_bins_43]